MIIAAYNEEEGIGPTMAEQEGADVSGLVVGLNDAAELLAEAKIAYGLEQFDEAAGFADLCSEVGEAVHACMHDNISQYILSSWCRLNIWKVFMLKNSVRAQRNSEG